MKIKLNKQKKKMDNGHQQILLPGGHIEVLETYERMLNITSHHRDAN